MRALVSCIIPTRNRLSFLKRALESILRQTYNNYEIIIIDDNSDKKVYEGIKKIIYKNDKIRYFRNETVLGGGESRNVGISKAKGEYLAFLDDDDEWLPNKLSLQIKYLNKHTFVGSKLNYITPGTSFSWVKDFVNTLSNTKVTKANMEDVFLHRTGISPSSSIFKAKNLKKISGFDASLKANQGRDLFIRYSKKFEPPLVINKRLVNQYQDHLKNRISDNLANRINANKYISNKYSNLVKRDILLLDKYRIRILENKYESKTNSFPIEFISLKNFLSILKLYIQNFFR